MRGGELESLIRVDADVRAVVAQAISHDSDAATATLEALRTVYANLIDAVTGERARVGAQLSALSNGRRAVDAYHARHQG